MTATYQYDAFGAVKTKTGTSDTAYRFTGELQDAQVARELYYLRARYYDPALGRFLGRDPFWASLFGHSPRTGIPTCTTTPFATWPAPCPDSVGSHGAFMPPNTRGGL